VGTPMGSVPGRDKGVEGGAVAEGVGAPRHPLPDRGDSSLAPARWMQPHRLMHEAGPITSLPAKRDCLDEPGGGGSRLVSGGPKKNLSCPPPPLSLSDRRPSTLPSGPR